MLHRKVHSHSKNSKKDHYVLVLVFRTVNRMKIQKLVLSPVLSIIRILTSKKDILFLFNVIKKCCDFKLFYLHFVNVSYIVQYDLQQNYLKKECI